MNYTKDLAVDERQFAALLNQLLPSKQAPLLQRFLLLLFALALAWGSLAGLIVLLFNALAPQFHAAWMTYAEGLGWAGFVLLYVGVSLLLKETK